ncbi:MAG: DnaJ domain-containing protein, partial [Bacillota bacterium]|nr:DnaJ domain-containing protein [Bacillota bacterium]
MDNYYDILNVSKDSDIKEIKRAYAKLLRKFPPETNPEEFKKIRKAYEALLDIKSRSAHNASIKADTASNTSTSQNNFSNTGNSDIITKQNGFSNTEPPNIITNKTILSKTKLSNKDIPIKNVVNSFTINSNSDNDNFYINSETDFKEVLSLVSNYCSSKNYQSAINILNSAIDKNNPHVSQNILYYIQLINIYITIRNMNRFNECIDKINQIVISSENKGTSAFILGELNNIYLDLYKNNKYSYCKELINKMLEMFPNETNLKSEQLNITMILDFKSSIHIFMNDSHILPCLKTLIGMWFNENITDQEKKSILDTYNIELCHTSIYNLINSIK